VVCVRLRADQNRGRGEQNNQTALHIVAPPENRSRAGTNPS
jgi:hypothetical protein